MPETPRYRVTEESFIHNALIPAGTEIEFTGQPGSALEPLNDAAKAAKVAAAKKGATLVTGDVVDAHAGDVEALVKERTPRKQADKTAKAETKTEAQTQGGDTQSGGSDEFA